MTHEQYCQRINALLQQLTDVCRNNGDMDAVKMVFAELADTVFKHGADAMRGHAPDETTEELARLIALLMHETDYQPKNYH